MVARKTCSICNIDKDAETDFVKDSSRIGKHSYLCKSCSRERGKDYYTRNREKFKEKHLRKTYGISLQELRDKLLNQKSMCSCCGTSLNIEEPYSAVVDHCHSTNRIRDILCNSCNKALGLINENIETLKGMITYLDRWKEENVNGST